MRGTDNEQTDKQNAMHTTASAREGHTINIWNDVQNSLFLQLDIG